MINFNFFTGVTLNTLTYIKSIKLTLDNGSGFISNKVITDFAGTINGTSDATEYQDDGENSSFTVDFTWLNDSSSAGITGISLCSDEAGDTVILTTDKSLLKETTLFANKTYHIKLTGIVSDDTHLITQYLRFENTIATPRHATTFREGLVRFSLSNSDKDLKSSTVYSAATVDDLLSNNVPSDLSVSTLSITTDGTSNSTGAKLDYDETTGGLTITLVNNDASTKPLKLSVDGVESKSYTGEGVQTETTDWNSTANNSKLPTVEVVSFATNDLQDQIDALNAGQNLADIVANDTDLANQDLTNLKARGDKFNNTDDTLLTIGDKVQILSDEINDSLPTVYELVKGEIPGTATLVDGSEVAYKNGDALYIKSETTGYYWEYIGVYGSSPSSASKVTNGQLEVGAIGLFMYSETGDEKPIGTKISGVYLTPVGMSLPFSGEIQYKMAGNAQSGTFTLMSVAFKRTALSPCLVLAQKTSVTTNVV